MIRIAITVHDRVDDRILNNWPLMGPEELV